MINDLEKRVLNYWTLRSHDFSIVRKNELENEMGNKWTEELKTHMPVGQGLDILDLGTGTGFFAILLARLGHKVEAVDLTPAMLKEAKTLAEKMGLDISFKEMDAMSLSYPDQSFDFLVSRNLTWTLPDLEEAYREWFRVLRPSGILLNFDADYAANVRSHSDQNYKVKADSPYGHIGMTDDLQKENDAITLSMDSGKARPAWDKKILEEIGFSDCRIDLSIGRRILGDLDLKKAPMFGVWAKK